VLENKLEELNLISDDDDAADPLKAKLRQCDSLKYN
jgi:hypothetical protein